MVRPRTENGVWQVDMNKGKGSLQVTGLIGGSSGVSVKSADELNSMREAGKVVASVIALLTNLVQPGMKTLNLDELAAKEIKQLGAKPAFLGYRGFPATICTSINEEIVHGIPSDRVLLEGDLVKVDVGAIVDGLYGDAAVTLGLGAISPEAQELINTTRESLNAGIMVVTSGVKLGDVGSAIQHYAESRGYGVVREYVGHGIGRALHEDPQIPNYGVSGKGFTLKSGMAIAIEPMLNVGTWRTKVLEDQWTVISEDRSLSAHFEHSMIVTDGNAEILTVL